MALAETIGAILGAGVVCFLQFLIVFAILKSYTNRKKLPYNIQIVKYSAIGGLLFGIASCIISVGLVGHIMLLIIIISVILWLTSLFLNMFIGYTLKGKFKNQY